MNSRNSVYVLLGVILMLSISIISVNALYAPGPSNPNNQTNQTTAYQLLHGQNNTIVTGPPVTVKTDLKSYKQGDSIIMTGLVNGVLNQTAVTIRILNPLQNLVQIDQLLPAKDGSFSKTYIATGPLWKQAGNYTISVRYGSNQANETFSFSGGTGSTSINPVINGTFQLQAGQQTYPVPYIIKGGTVKNMNVYSDKLTLEITIDAPTDGSITAILPREMIDAKVPANLTKDEIMAGIKINPQSLADDKFFVLIGGQNAQFTETTTTLTARTLSIPFHAGDTTIDIIGTQIVPEFGPIAALVLAIAIISIIAVSAKTGLRFMPKY